ncbi:hypothetical protein [Eisenbergiella sp.]
MMLEEFEKRTGYFPTMKEYEVIERAYIHFEGDKDAFCKAYKKNEGEIARMIQHEANMQTINEQNEIEKLVESYKFRIAELEKALEREQEWKRYEDTDNVSQADYIKLRTASGTRALSDEEAKELLFDWFGFAKEKIKIYHCVPVYEVNRHRQLRKVGELDRFPLYNATDWNYIRFDCGRMCYELKDDELRPYLH